MDFDVIEKIIEFLLGNPFYLIGGIILFAFIFLFIGRTRRMPYYSREKLLTRAEWKFYLALRKIIDDKTLIMMKVRMADIIHCNDRDWNRGWGYKISSKHIDFVLIDKETTDIKICIELDDSTHRTVKARMDRDKFVNKAFETAGVRLVRIPTMKFYKKDDIKNYIDKNLMSS
jgi:hypothetical protein